MHTLGAALHTHAPSRCKASPSNFCALRSLRSEHSGRSRPFPDKVSVKQLQICLAPATALCPAPKPCVSVQPPGLPVPEHLPRRAWQCPYARPLPRPPIRPLPRSLAPTSSLAHPAVPGGDLAPQHRVFGPKPCTLSQGTASLQHLTLAHLSDFLAKLDRRCHDV